MASSSKLFARREIAPFLFASAVNHVMLIAVNRQQLAEKIYRWVSRDESEPTCRDISDEACAVVPKNFLTHLLATIATKTADSLSKPGLIITWMLSSLGAPAAAIGALVPVREAGSLLPQLAIGGILRRFTIRKYFWVIGNILQGLAILSIAAVPLFFKGATAGWTAVGLLVIFSLSRGISSVTSKDLVGRTIPKTRRGRLSGTASSIAGWIAVGVGVFFAFNRKEDMPSWFFAVLIGIAGLLWLIAAAVMAGLDEKPAETSKNNNALDDTLDGLKLLRDDRTFLKFCIARALLASTVLSMPFYVIIARAATGGNISSLGILMVAGSVATALSAAIWGRLADKSSRLTLAIAGIAAGVVGCVTAAIAGFDLGSTASSWLFGVLFFLIGLAHTGIRLGRKTYLIDMATADNRATLVAVSNTLIGIVLLLSASFGLLANAIGERGVILVFALLGIAGGALALALPEVQEPG